jgi:hypothetical protein
LGSLDGIYVLGLEAEEQTATEINPRARITPKRLLSNDVVCAPKVKDGTNVVDVLFGRDYNDVTCSIFLNPSLGTFHIFGFGGGVLGSGKRWGDTTVEELADWLFEAQKGIQKLGMKRDSDLIVKVEKFTKEDEYSAGYVSAEDQSKILHLSTEETDKVFMKNASVHEYFHHAQTRTQSSFEGGLSDGNAYPTSLWLVEGSASWFEDYLFDDDNSYLTGESLGLSRILEKGLMADASNYSNDKNKITDNKNWSYKPYQRFAMFKLLEKECNKLGKNGDYALWSNVFGEVKPEPVTDFFSSKYDPDKFIDLIESNCDFGNALGKNNKSKLETGMIWFQYVTQFRKIFKLLDIEEDEPNNLWC